VIDSQLSIDILAALLLANATVLSVMALGWL